MANTFKADYFNTLEKEYHVPHSILGAPLSPRTANQLDEATKRLNAGVKNIELSAVSTDVFHSIPREHFKEINRLNKLTGSKASIHTITDKDIAGFGKDGWSEEERMQSERILKDTVEKAHDLDPEGNTPVVIHSSGGVPGYIWQKYTEGGKEVPMPGETEIPPEGMRVMTVINQETGELTGLKYEEKEYVGRKKIWRPMERLENLNLTQWDKEKKSLLDLQHQKSEVQERLDKVTLNPHFTGLLDGANRGTLNEKEEAEFQSMRRSMDIMRQHMHEIDSLTMSGLQDLHHKTKFYPDEEKKELEELRKRAVVDPYNQIQKEIEKREEELENIENDSKKRNKLNEIHNLREQQISILQQGLGRLPPPPVWKKTDDFAIDKASDTIANTAMYAYDKYGENAPIIAVENVYPEWTIGRAESLKKAVEESRTDFANKLVKEKNMSRDKAEETAKKIIGATWDVAHINLLRKYGYSEEDIVEETKKIAPYIKHLHIGDNFGFQDTHLAPGMGNVPFKKIWEELKKEGYEGRAVVEAPNVPIHFKISPHPATLEALNSPLYETKAGPYWSDIVDTYGNYSMPHGEEFPPQHFATYGTGLTTLPRELGGEIGKERSRFAGTPNQ